MRAKVAHVVLLDTRALCKLGYSRIQGEVEGCSNKDLKRRLALIEDKTGWLHYHSSGGRLGQSLLLTSHGLGYRLE